MNRKVIVIGGGPAGLGASWRLSDKNIPVLLLEAENQLGGMSASFKYKDMFLDYGPHAFHIKNSEISAKIKQICQLYEKENNTQMLVENKFLDYPLNLKNAIFDLNPLTSLKIGVDIVFSHLKNYIHPSPENSFEDWGINKFGKTLYTIFFGRYTKKVWGIPASDLSVHLALQKLSKLSIIDLLLDVFQKKKGKDVFLGRFSYPKITIQQTWDNISRKIKEQGGTILTSSKVYDIRVKNHNVEKIIFSANGTTKVLDRPQYVISTIPINELIKMITPKPPEDVLMAAEKLKYRSLILVYIIVKRPKVFNPLWIYLLEDRFQFNRICEQKNLSDKSFPPDKTVLILEKTCNFGDRTWMQRDEELFKRAVTEVQNAGLLDGEEIEGFFVKKIRYAYPIYSIGFMQDLNTCIDYLSDIYNLFSTGRQGLFLNNDMHDSIEMGFLAGDMVFSTGKSKSWYSQMRDYHSIKVSRSNESK